MVRYLVEPGSIHKETAAVRSIAHLFEVCKGAIHRHQGLSGQFSVKLVNERHARGDVDEAPINTSIAAAVPAEVHLGDDEPTAAQHGFYMPGVA